MIKIVKNETTDMFGRKIITGDFIAYPVKLSCSAKLRVGVFTGISENDKTVVTAFEETWSGKSTGKATRRHISSYTTKNNMVLLKEPTAYTVFTEKVEDKFKSLLFLKQDIMKKVIDI